MARTWITIRAVAIASLMLGGIACQADSSQETPTDDGWRRTANGWEPVSLLATQRPIIEAKRGELPPLRFPGTVHPLAWAGLQISLSLLGLAMFQREEE